MDKRAEEVYARDLLPGDHVCLTTNAVVPGPAGTVYKVNIRSGATVILDILDMAYISGVL